MMLANVIPMPTNVIRFPKGKTIYVKRVSVKQIRKLMELGFTVVLR